MEYKNILIRADSSATIGTGHVMRCLVLANTYKNSKVVFATQNLQGNVNYKITQAAYEYVVLQTNSFHELQQTIDTLNIDMLVIDHYGIDYEYEKKIKIQNPHLHITVLDDTYEKHCCDTLINHNIYADTTRYADKVPKNCRLLCGSKYTLLRNEFKTLAKGAKKYDVFVAMGGSDPQNLSFQIVNLLQNYGLKIALVSTKANMHLKQLQEFVKIHNNIELFVDTSQVATLMSASKFAIVSASSLLNEIYYLNLPFIAVQTAQNQRYMVEFLQQNGFDAMQAYDAEKLKNFVQKKIER
jgi:UDP-2,4-diacetamido-2,4,6-trideoxy-beta-L-altropyranose hydrolase